MYLGIDCGLDGCLCQLQDEVRFYDAPTVKVGTRRRYDVPGIVELLSLMANWECHAFLEKMQPMPRSMTSGVANFSLGYSAGMWEAALVALEIPYTLVSPVRWKRVIMPDMAKGKDSSRVRALQLRPDLSEQLKRVRDHNRADSFLLAEYGRRSLNGGF